jgi:hypothetical protein
VGFAVIAENMPCGGSPGVFMTHLIRLTIGTLVLALIACAESTTFTSTWKAPDAASVTPVGKTIAAVFVTRDEAQRRAAEDTLARDLTARGAHAIPSYTMLPNDRHANAEAARARFKEAGADGVVVMRVVGKDQRVTYTPGTAFPTYYNGFGPYWGYGWQTAYSPGYLETDTLISVETLVYSLRQDKLLWGGTSRTINPDSLSTLVTEVADATAKEMTKQGLLLP